MINKNYLSIIIPVYNGETYIRKTLTNIARKCVDSEIVVVNDGSTDNTLLELKKIANIYKNIVIIDKKNGGVSSARNIGIEKATGEYIFFLDSDDYAIATTLNEIKKQIKNGKYDIIKCDYITQRKIKLLYKYNKSMIGKTEEKNLNEVYKSILTSTNFNSVCTMIIKKEIIGDIRFNQSYSMAEDLDFCMKLIDKSRNLLYISKPIIKYMYNSNSATRKNDLSKKEKYLKDILSVYSKKYFFNEKWNKCVLDEEISKHIEEICYYLINENVDDKKRLEEIFISEFRKGE